MVVDDKKCIGCGACISVCKVGAIKLINGRAHIDNSKCVKCGACVSICPMQAISAKDENVKKSGSKIKKNTKK